MKLYKSGFRAFSLEESWVAWVSQANKKLVRKHRFFPKYRLVYFNQDFGEIEFPINRLF